MNDNISKLAAATVLTFSLGARAFAGLVNQFEPVKPLVAMPPLPGLEQRMPVGVPNLEVAVPDLGSLPDDHPDCTDASLRVDRLEASILDLKARYWAIQLRKKISLRNLVANPGSTITDRDLKNRFFAQLEAYYAAGDAAPLSHDEVKRFLAADEAAFRLHTDCGL